MPNGINLSYNKNRIGPIFECCAIWHLSEMLDCVNTPLSVAKISPIFAVQKIEIESAHRLIIKILDESFDLDSVLRLRNLQLKRQR
jgi:hypothetical protein